MNTTRHTRFSFTVIAAFVLIASFALVNCGGGGGGGDGILPTYTVTYDGNGNTGGKVPVDSIGYETGQLVAVPGNTGALVKAGASFTGWNTRADGNGTTYTQPQTFLMGAADVTLYAKWTTNPTYTVTYDGTTSDSGNVPVDSTNYETGQTVTVLGSGSLVKNGFYFAGWNMLSDGTGTTYGASFTMGSENVTLFAKWTANPTYTVTYDVNTADTGSVPVDPARYEAGATVTVPGNPGFLAKGGFTFAGWCVNSDGTGDSYTEGQTFIMGSADVTLFAKWTENPTYTVTYDANVNTPYTPSGSVPIDTTHYEAGATVAVSGNTGNLATNRYQDGIHLVFHSWNTQSDGFGTPYTQGQNFSMGTADVILYAQWSVLRGAGPGGLVFYDKGYFSAGWRYLEAAPVETEWNTKQWGASGTLIGGTSTAIGAGQANTTAIVTWLNNNVNDANGDVTNKADRAAYLCDALDYNAKSDWFLPSKDELHEMYVNLYQYGVGGYIDYVYLSSSEYNTLGEWIVDFTTGSPTGNTWDKASAGTSTRIRAIRAF